MPDQIDPHASQEFPIETISVLVVDDDERIRATTCEALASLGYLVASAVSGQVALSLYRADAGAYDLVLTDVRMPGMNGFELAQHLRAIDTSVPVLLMTGDDVRHSDSANGDTKRILSKPFALSELETAILETLGMS